MTGLARGRGHGEEAAPRRTATRPRGAGGLGKPAAKVRAHCDSRPARGRLSPLTRARLPPGPRAPHPLGTHLKPPAGEAHLSEEQFPDFPENGARGDLGACGGGRCARGTTDWPARTPGPPAAREARHHGPERGRNSSAVARSRRAGRVNVRPQSVRRQRLLHPQGRKGDLSPGPRQPPSDLAIGAEASTSRRAAARPPALALKAPVTATSQQEHGCRPRGRAPRERQVTADATARGTAPGPHARGRSSKRDTRPRGGPVWKTTPGAGTGGPGKAAPSPPARSLAANHAQCSDGTTKAPVRTVRGGGHLPAATAASCAPGSPPHGGQFCLPGPLCAAHPWASHATCWPRGALPASGPQPSELHWAPAAQLRATS